jgi:tripartite-type tricarboxylate transporter receptor subunit TctC
MFRSVLCAAVAGLFAVTGSASAQNFPTRPVTMIIPFAAGGPTDVLGRIVGARMSELLGQQIVIENVGGAGGQTGSKRVVDAKPDGYTIGIGTVGTHAQGQTLYKRPLYNSQTDVQPVALLAQVPILLTVRKDLPAKDLKEFVAYAKANQDKMNFGSAGAGSATHLGCVLLNHLMGTKINHIPFRGTGPAMAELQAGRIDFMCEVMSTAKPHVEGGTIRALTIMNATRSAALPNIPSSKEQGMPDLVAYTWNAIFAPKGLPKDILAKLNKVAVDAISSPAVKEKLAGLGAEVATGNQTTPEYLAKLVKDETEKWAVPIKASGVSVE